MHRCFGKDTSNAAITVVLLSVLCSHSSAVLQLVHAIWRHGDRIPLHSWPHGDVDPDSWHYPLGELTKEGMREMKSLGKSMKDRYINFLSPSYSAYEIDVRSSDYNRTIASALVLLAGMYPPSNSEKFDANLEWQPIPVHVVPKLMDNIVYMDRSCPPVDNEYWNDVQQSPEVLNIMKENKDFLDFVRQQTGEPLKILHYMYYVYDTLLAMKQHNIPWPSWVNETVFQKMEQLNDRAKYYYYNRPSIQRFRGGPLLRDVLERMRLRISGELDPRFKFYGYSGHDSTLIGFFQSLGAYGLDSHVPPYASVIYVELHQEEENKERYVKVFYQNEPDSEPVAIAISECPENTSVCKFSDFERRSDGRWTEDWFEECGVTEKRFVQGLKTSVIAISTILGVTVVGIVISACSLFRRRKCDQTL